MKTKINLPMKKRMSLVLAGTLAMAAVVPSFGSNIANQIVNETYASSYKEIETSIATNSAIEETAAIEQKNELITQEETMVVPRILDESKGISQEIRGQRMFFTHKNDKASLNVDGLKEMGYYLFDTTSKAMTIEADIEVKDIQASSSYGIFIGMFNEEGDISGVTTLGIRGDQSVRNIYTKNLGGAPGAGGINTKLNIGDKVHVVIQKTNNGCYTEVTNNGETKTATVSYSNAAALDDINTPVRYGIGLSNASIIVTNLVYKDADENIYFKQTDYYKAVGKAPSIESVNESQIAKNRKTISVSWNGESPEDDGKYKVELSKDNGETYTVLDTDVMEKTYTTKVNESGTYIFRISGICGTTETEPKLSPAVSVLAPLQSPVLNATSSDGQINLTWEAVAEATSYEIYRKNDVNEEGILIGTTTTLGYSDQNVINEEPYYYEVIAKSANNSSNPSEPLIMVATAGREGKYVYEDQATHISMTKKSYDTVYKDKATLEGSVDRNGEMVLEVNGQVQQTIKLAKGDKFAFKANLVAGRNDVNLLFKDEVGKVTRKTFNFVYLTNYDIVVDQNYTGEDGQLAKDGSSVKMYKTVQAAVNSVADTNAKRIVILIKEGNYVEYLRVKSPYITLIGEDREKVNVNFFDPEITKPGGDTKARSAIYIEPSATGFTAENLTFENTYKFKGDGSSSNESSDAIRVDADEATFVNVKLVGYQDTLQTNTNRQYFYKCVITGNVDFIYGVNARTLIEDCDIVYRYNANKNSGYVIAPRTDASAKYGYIFNNCRITAEENCNGDKYLLARPWGPDAAVTFINTYMSGIINKSIPYSDMSGNEYRKARFKEFYSYGDGYAINGERPQISKVQAEEMLTADFLGWNPYAVAQNVGQTDFVGNVVTEVPEKFIENKEVEDAHVDKGLGAYSVEGYARQVTGGGIVSEESEAYYKVSTAEEFLNALQEMKVTSKAGVIELTADINLGSIEVGDALEKYSKVIKAVSNAPLLHPTLLKTGVSTLNIKDMSNLTIYSKNGASIKHACINMSNASNIIIRNIVFDEIWEWDEGGVDNKGEYCKPGDYDRNDWDYINVQNGSTNIWIDHCTFYKAYDGIVDIKKAGTAPTNVTISWCQFLPESKSGFFDEMMDLLESNPEKYPYYNGLLTEHGMTKEQIRRFAAAQKKTHLVGASDKEANIENLQLTLANNYYKNSMDRMPRLRGGNAHVYNCILDAADIYKLKNEVTDAYMKEKVVSNGAISTCNASVLLENTVIDSIINALASGNGSSPGGYINAVNTVYYMDGKLTNLGLTDNAGLGMLLDIDQFKSSLPYTNYNLYNAISLTQKVMPFAGAGTINMSSEQWQKTKYKDDVIGMNQEVTVRFNYAGANGNNTVVKLQAVVGNTYGILPSPTKAGYTFLGWYDEKGNKVTAETIINNESTQVLTAKWKQQGSNTETPKVSEKPVVPENTVTGGGGSKSHSVKVNIITTPQNTEQSRISIDKENNVVEPAKTKFKDVSGHWAAQAITYVSEKGILKGVSTNQFVPNKTMTRAMFASMLYRLAGEPVVETNATFKDVKANAWYTKSAVWANKEGIIKGISADKFAPNQEVTREQMAVMLYNYLKVTNQTLTLSDEAVKFNDVFKVSTWAEDAMSYMKGAGIINGDDKGNCNPKAKATRAEVSVMMHRFIIALENK
ncbi:pectinesterase family protein [Cellulosilyticum ruminicola]